MATNSLHSRQRDHRLLGGSNNIQYQREARQPSSATHVSTLQQSGTAVSVYNSRSDNENGDLETPRPLTEEELNPNLVAQSLVAAVATRVIRWLGWVCGGAIQDL